MAMVVSSKLTELIRQRAVVQTPTMANAPEGAAGRVSRIARQTKLDYSKVAKRFMRWQKRKTSRQNAKKTSGYSDLLFWTRHHYFPLSQSDESATIREYDDGSIPIRSARPLVT